MPLLRSRVVPWPLRKRRRDPAARTWVIRETFIPASIKRDREAIRSAFAADGCPAESFEVVYGSRRRNSRVRKKDVELYVIWNPREVGEAPLVHTLRTAMVERWNRGYRGSLGVQEWASRKRLPERLQRLILEQQRQMNDPYARGQHEPTLAAISASAAALEDRWAPRIARAYSMYAVIGITEQAGWRHFRRICRSKRGGRAVWSRNVQGHAIRRHLKMRRRKRGAAPTFSGLATHLLQYPASSEVNFESFAAPSKQTAGVWEREVPRLAAHPHTLSSLSVVPSTGPNPHR